MKRKLTLFLSAVMAASCLPMTAYAANFKDINELPWASVSINSAADRGLVSGYDENGARYYKPKNNVTYCEAMQMVYNSLQKTGTAAYMEATKTYSYMQTLTTIGVPRWAQIATAYGLENGLVDMQTVVAKFAGGKQLATREDIARILGNAMAVRYDYEKVNSAAAEFKDYWRISDKAVSQVDLLKRLNIITGTNGNFLPKNNITRAEMAVMLNNTYDVLKEGVTVKGEITELTNNEGAFYYIEVKLPSGLKNGYYAKDDLTVYEGSTEKKIPVSRLSKGDQVELMMNGDTLLAIRQLTGVDAQAKYDVTGYWDSVKDGILEIENENTGDSDEYNVDNDTLYYLDGVKIKLKDLQEELKANYKKHAYVGVMTEVRRERNSETKRYEDVTYAVEVHVTFTEEYTTSGEVKKLSSTNITVKPEGSSAEKDYILAASCKIYIGDEVVTVSKAKDLVESGTTYAKITVNQEGDVITLVLAEDTFENSPAKADATTYKVVSFSDKKMVLKSNAKETTYTFGSTNPVNNIAFYTWDSSDKEWDDVD
ncbi:MAG: S-layer homology domain-containing protein, partial [Anaerotignum sp.]|nr:S-layer homology domain-containing protein [Anaerotignum sp.]